MKSVSTINMFGKRTIDYIFQALACLNNGAKKVELTGVGSNANKVMEVAHILKKFGGFEVEPSGYKNLELYGCEVSALSMQITAPKNTRLLSQGSVAINWIDEEFDHLGFIGFPTYHLILENLLHRDKSIEIMMRDYKSGKMVSLLEIHEKNGKRVYRKSILDGTNQGYDKEGRYKSSVESALYRSGFFLPNNIQRISERLSKHDDVILGPDTNLFYNCVITEHLLPMLTLVEPNEFVHTPNWVLFIVPATVMFELENAANSKNERGLLNFHGRMAYRALQEIVELSHNIDIPGVSLMIHGESNPILDTKDDLRGIREGIVSLANSSRSNFYSKSLKKSSSGDMAIRGQFKKFLSQIDFHKGTYFLTGDKANAAMAMAEGLSSIYIGYPPEMRAKKDELHELSLGAGKGSKLNSTTPLGKLIYEFAVNFGEIKVKIKGSDKVITLSCDQKGESLGHWLQRQLRISRDDLTVLLEEYGGLYDLRNTFELFENVMDRFENIEWISEMRSALKD